MKRLFLTLAFLWMPQFASAHATPLLYEPASSAVLQHAPGQVSIRFSERIEPRASSITVFGPDGKDITAGMAQVDASDAYGLSVKLADEGSGSYSVSWQVVSADDGHFTKGAYVFYVGKGNAGASTASFEILHKTSLPEAFTIWLELMGQSLLLGCMLLSATIGFAVRKRGLGTKGTWLLDTRLTYLQVAGVIFIITGVVAYLLIRSGDLEIGSTSFASALQDFSGTATGRYALYRALLAVAYIALFFSFRRSLESATRIGTRWSLLMIPLLLMLLLRAEISHAAASHIHPALSVFINFLHLLGKEGWIGGLMVLFVAFLPVLMKEGNRKIMAYALSSFSRLLNVALCVGGVTGTYIVWLHLKDFSNVETTLWGQRFVALTLFAFLLLGLRLYQQLRSDKNTSAMPSLWARVGLETAAGIVVLFLSSLLIITTPPLRYGDSFAKTVQSQGMDIRLEEHPYDDDHLLLTFAGEHPVTGVVVTLTNEEKDIGPIVAETDKRFEGGYAIDERQLSPAGTWDIDVTGTRNGAYDAVAHFSIDYPQVASMRPAATFTWICIVIALLIVVLALYLWFFATRALRAADDVPDTVVTFPAGRRASLVALDIVLVLGVLYALQNYAQGSFQRLCTANGHMWHESIPMREGQVTSTASVLGCMVGMGQAQFHFGDRREYEYFTRPVSAIAAFLSEKDTFTAGVSSTLSFRMFDPQGKPLEELLPSHDSILHTVIIGQDLATFAHIHQPGLPEAQPDGSVLLHVPVTFPKAGTYIVAINFTIRSKEFAQEFYVTVGGGPAMDPPQKTISPLQETVDGYQIQLAHASVLRSNVVEKFSYDIRKDGTPVTDLQPYLAAPMHISIVKDDLTRFVHTHGLIPKTLLEYLTEPKLPPLTQHTMFLPEAFGPALEAYTMFPSAGTYVIFGEFKDGGRVVATRFVVNVAP